MCCVSNFFNGKSKPDLIEQLKIQYTENQNDFYLQRLTKQADGNIIDQISDYRICSLIFTYVVSSIYRRGLAQFILKQLPTVTQCARSARVRSTHSYAYHF